MHETYLWRNDADFRPSRISENRSRRKFAVDAVRHGSFKDASVILPAYEEMERFVLLDRKGGAGGIEAIGAQRVFLAV